MSLEAYTGKISDLVDSNPTPTDPKSQGDDHLRGIKYTLKQSFPNFDGPTTQFPGQVTPNEITIGRNVDQGKNFKVTVPNPEDGTLTIERANGTDVMKFLANGGVDMPSLPFSKTANGYMTLPNGLIVQWGTTSNVTTEAITFPIPFPGAKLSTLITPHGGPANITVSIGASSTSGFTWFAYAANTAAGAAVTCQWIAIGY